MDAGCKQRERRRRRTRPSCEFDERVSRRSSDLSRESREESIGEPLDGLRRVVTRRILYVVFLTSRAARKVQESSDNPEVRQRVKEEALDGITPVDHL
jgi:hypothetical protein